MAIAGELVVKLAADVAELRTGFQQAQRAVSGFASRMETTLKGIGIAAALGGLLRYSKALIDEMGVLQDQADQLGISTDALQAWGETASEVGVSTEKFTAALTKLNVALGKAFEGDAKTIETLEKLRVKILDVNGQIRPLEALLPEIARGVDGLGTQAEKSAALVQLFGRSGAAMVAAMQKLGLSTEEAIRKMKEQGRVFDADLIKKADALGESIERLNKQFKVAFSQAALKPGVDALSEIASILEKYPETISAIERALITFLIGPILWAIRLVQSLRDNILALRDKLDASGAEQRRGLGEAIGGALGTAAGNLPTRPGVSNPPTTAQKGIAQKAAEEIAKLTRETELYQERLKMLQADVTTPFELLSKQLDSIQETEKKMMEATKELQGQPGLAAEMKFRVIALEKAKLAVEEYEAALQFAAETEKQFGDGTQQYAETMAKLAIAVSDGRISVQTFERAAAAAQETFRKQSQSPEMLEFLDGVKQGFEQLGETIFDVMMGAQADIKQAVSQMLMYLAKLAFQIFVMRPLFNALGNVLGGFTGGIGGGTASGGAGVAGARQHGGPVWPGAAFLVGERGPERFIPSVPGRIEPMGEGTGQTVNIAIDARGVVTDADDPARAAELGRRVKAAVLDILRNERRPGGMLTQRL